MVLTPQPYSQYNSELVCEDVSVEPQLQQLSGGEMFSNKTANKLDQARVDVSAYGFWLTGQVAFSDVRVFNSTTKYFLF